MPYGLGAPYSGFAMPPTTISLEGEQPRIVAASANELCHISNLEIAQASSFRRVDRTLPRSFRWNGARQAHLRSQSLPLLYDFGFV
jgi:hypothetical protein